MFHYSYRNKTQTSSYLVSQVGKIYLETKGRLGNVLFQYATIYGIGVIVDREVIIYSEIDIKNTFPQITTKVMKSNNVTKKIMDKLPLVKELNSGIFTPLLANNLIRGNVKICCYLQSYKYFWHVKERLIQEFQFSDSINKKAHAILHRAQDAVRKDRSILNTTFIGIHVRRGDLTMKRFQDDGYRLPTTSFFTKAKAYYTDLYSNIVFIVASDDKTWSKKNLKAEDTYFSDAKSGSVDMALMAACNHTITTVGTFSWWAAFLAGGQAIYYKDFIRNNSSITKKFKLEDRYPVEWIPMGD